MTHVLPSAFSKKIYRRLKKTWASRLSEQIHIKIGNNSGLSINSTFYFTIISDYLKPLSAEELEYLMKKEADEYPGKEFTHAAKNLNTPNVNTKGDKITFKMEIREIEA